MLNRMSFAAVLLTATCRYALALVSVYHVAPVKSAWSEWTHRGVAVSQTLTCNFDSLSYVELFAGIKGAGGAYTATVLEDGVPLVSSQGNQVTDHGWVSFESWNSRTAFTKGKQYELRFTRGTDDSMECYYDGRNPYPYGHMRFDRADETGRDLCCRVYGRLNAVDTSWYGVANHYFEVDSLGQTAALDTAARMGIRWLKEDFWGWEKWVDDPTAVVAAWSDYLRRGFSVLGMLCYCSPDSAVSSYPHGDATGANRSKYPPRNLDTGNNYWAEYCDSIMGSLCGIAYWEVWGEPNAYWCWSDPDTLYYGGSTPGPKGDRWIDTPRERCSLYVRMCRIAESTAKALGGNRKVVAGVTYRLQDNDGGATVSSGVDWIRDMFNLAELRFGGVENCFDMVSVHPYMFYSDSTDERLSFTEDKFRRDLDTARAIMRAANCAGMELWATEYGWPRWKKGTNHQRVLTDTLVQADNLCKFFTSAIARQADPRGGYDRTFLYELNGHHFSPGITDDNEGFGLLDSNPDQTRLPQSWAMQQAIGQLTGHGCNGQVMTDGSVTDSAVRVYEFEDEIGRRTWTCWKEGENNGHVYVKLPVRTYSLIAESLAYSRTPPGFLPKVNDDGWLTMDLTSRPMFISEKTAPQRPDLRVDSVQFVQAGSVVRAWVTNHGTRATPVRSGSRVPYPTWAVLRADGDSLAQVVRTNSIGVDQQTEFRFNLGQTQLPDTALLRVTVNPDQTYVELGTDDNTGYTLVAKP
jgi:hypothetical protein